MIAPWSPDLSLPSAAALTTASKSGLLASLLAGAASPTAHATRCRLNPEATRLLLEVLAALGIAEPDGAGGYLAARSVREGCAAEVGGHAFNAALFGHLEQFAVTGEPLHVMNAGEQDREAAYAKVVADLGARFERAAAALATRLGGGADRGPLRVLDIGCGSGVWSLSFAAARGDCTTTGLDFPKVLEKFAARAQRLGLGDQIRLLPGDAFGAELTPLHYDVIFIANVLRLEPEARARQLVVKAAAALAPAGRLVIVDALADATPEATLARALYALHLALRTQEARVHDAPAMRSWLDGCDLGEVTLISLEPALGALVASRG